MSSRASRDNRMKSGWNVTGLLCSALIPNNVEMVIPVVVIFLNDTFNFIQRKTSPQSFSMATVYKELIKSGFHWWDDFSHKD